MLSRQRLCPPCMQSRIVWGLAPPLLYIAAIATAVATYHSLVERGLLHGSLPTLNMANNGPFGLTSFALSLLLVFRRAGWARRTNASYARWLDARKTLGGAITYFPPQDAALADALCRWTVAYRPRGHCSATAWALGIWRAGLAEHRGYGDPRAPCSTEDELPQVLQCHEAAAVLAATHRPNYCLQVPADKAAAVRMDANITALEDATGTCERILRAPIPLSYTRHTSRFMITWLSLLPFSLWDSLGWAEVPLSVIVAFLLLGIEEIGVSIEEPFSILPLEALCDVIEANVGELRSTHGRGAGAASDGNGSAERRPPPARQIVHAAREQLAADPAAG
eukprot:scaffold7.g3463.t1